MNLILQAIKSLFRKVEASRTHWDTRQTVTKKITFDGNMEGKETVQLDEYTSAVKISEEVPIADDVIGATATLYKDGEYLSAPITEGMIGPIDENSYILLDLVLMLRADLEVDDFPHLTKGVWVIREVDENGDLVLYPSSLEYTEVTGELKKLDEKYLPDSVAKALSSKMRSTNPVGTGSFSMNRKADSEVGAYSTALGRNNVAADQHLTAMGRYNICPVYTTYLKRHGQNQHINRGVLYSSSITMDGYTIVLDNSATTTVGELGNVYSSIGSFYFKYSSVDPNVYYYDGESSCTAAGINYTIWCNVVVVNRLECAVIVGNGTSDTERSNAHTLDWHGNAWYAGTVEGTAMIVKSSTANSTKKFKITVNDSGTITATEVT